MPNDIGVGGQMFVDGDDISPLLSGFRHTKVLGNVDSTRLRNPDRYRTHLNTLLGSSTGFTGDLPADDADALEHLAAYLDRKDAPHIFIQAPFGADPGKLARMGKSIRTSTELSTEIEGILSLSAEFEGTAGSPGVASGVCLFSPNLEGNSVSQNEIVDIVFTNADPNQFFGVRAMGTVQAFEFQTTIANAALKAGIEALPAYAGRTVTVTGAALTGSTAKSGTKRIEFDGATDVPALEIISGLVETFTVDSGDADADYRWNGSTARALGFSETQAQTDQQAITGRTGAIVKGSSVGSMPNVATGGTVTGTANNAGAPALAFDGDVDTNFVTNEGPGFLQYQFSAAKTPRYVTIIIGDNGSGNVIPPRLAFYGSNASAGSNYNVEPTSGTLLGNFPGMANDLSAWTSLGNNKYSRTFALTNNAAFGYMQMWYEIGSAGSVFIKEVRAYESNPVVGGYSATFKAYYPLAANALPAPTAAGAGAVASQAVASGGLAADVAPVTVQDGGTFKGGNVISAPVSGPVVHDIPTGQTSSAGMLLCLQNLLSSAGTSTWKLRHAPDASGSPGTFVDLLTFDAVSGAGAQYKEVPAGTTIYPHLRVQCTAITGSAQVAVAAARR